jgi:hypothetical protein
MLITMRCLDGPRTGNQNPDMTEVQVYTGVFVILFVTLGSLLFYWNSKRIGRDERIMEKLFKRKRKS